MFRLFIKRPEISFQPWSLDRKCFELRKDFRYYDLLAPKVNYFFGIYHMAPRDPEVLGDERKD